MRAPGASADVRTGGLNRRLTLTVLLTSGTALFLACAAFVAYDVVTLRSGIVQSASTLAEVIGINTAVALTFDDPEAATETLGSLAAVKPIRAAIIYDREGRVFARYTASSAAAEALEGPPPEVEAARFRGERLDLFRSIHLKGERLGTLYLHFDAHEITVRIERYLAIVLALLGVVSGVAVSISRRLRARVSLPLASLVRSSRAIADGDLSIRAGVAQGDDEIGILARTFDGMAAGLRDLVSQARNSTGEVTRVSESLQHSSGGLTREVLRQRQAIGQAGESLARVGESLHEVNANVEQLASAAHQTSASIVQMEASITEVAEHMDHLAGSIEVTSTAVSQVAGNTSQVMDGVGTLKSATEDAMERLAELGASVARVKGNAEESHALSAGSRQEATRGRAAVSETITAMGEIKTSFGRVQQSVSRLAGTSVSIDEIIQVIEDVADQTSLLSLNAAIIAAQAGEHGRAFSVVADQVKQLAGRTHQSTRQVAELIRAVQEETAGAVAAVEQGSAKVEKGVERSQVAGEVLNGILDQSSRTAQRVAEIVEATARQAGDLERLRAAMAGVERIVEQIHVSMREQKRATDEIAEAVGRIGSLGKQVHLSTEEQRRGSHLITNSVTTVSRMIEQIASATQAQARSGETIESALRVFQEVSERATRHAEGIEETVSALRERALHLELELRRFRTD
jgi:methyl-accepting chemotaxis protein